MRLRTITVLLLTYLLADFANPSMPGAFSFESEQFFVDGIAAKLKPPPVKPLVPQSSLGTVSDTHSAASLPAMFHQVNGVCGSLPRTVMPQPPKQPSHDTSSSDDAPLA